jgi:hypothetical protein
MDNDKIANELVAVKAALQGRDSSTITGGQLLALIQKVSPALDIRAIVGIPKGPGALKEFIRIHLPDVVERFGNQGGDILYRITGHDAAAMPTFPSPQIWRAFVSPRSPQHLVLNDSSGLLLARETPAGAGELEIPKASHAEHDRMRADFETSLPAAAAAILREHAPPGSDFETWMEALRKRLPEATRQWGHFRRQALADLLAGRIAGVGLDETPRRAALKQIKDAERAVYDMPKGDRQGSEKPKAPRPGAADDVARAYRLAQAAIGRLSYEELRALRIPMGAMLDAIQAES